MKIALCLHGLVGSKSSKYGGSNNINIEIPYKYIKKPIQTIGIVLIIKFLKVINPTLLFFRDIVSKAIFEISFFK